MKLPKMLERDFEPHFSVKHMLKDMEIADQIALSRYLDLGVTAAARDQLVEQVQWGHGDYDYSAVARKFLHDIAPAVHEEPQMEAHHEQSDASEPVSGTTASETPGLEPQNTSPTSAQLRKLSGPSSSGADDGSAHTASPLRRGFLRQLLSRFSSGQG
jgi:hypothetical protein